MKKVFSFLAVAMVSTSLYATEVREFYQVDFKVTDISSNCPKNAMCLTVGTNVTLTATLGGCMDKVVFTEFKTAKMGNKYVIHALGLAKYDPRSAVTRCYRANTHTETVTIHAATSDVEVINGSIFQN